MWRNTQIMREVSVVKAPFASQVHCQATSGQDGFSAANMDNKSSAMRMSTTKIWGWCCLKEHGNSGLSQWAHVHCFSRVSAVARSATSFLVLRQSEGAWGHTKPSAHKTANGEHSIDDTHAPRSKHFAHHRRAKKAGRHRPAPARPNNHHRRKDRSQDSPRGSYFISGLMLLAMRLINSWFCSRR